VLERHPENQPPYDVLLSQLGTYQIRKKFPGGAPGGEGQPQPTQAVGQPPALAAQAHPYTFNSRSAIWNNCGGALELLNSSGAVLATFAYGTHLAP
jgi:hypothetical protein